MGRHQKQKNQAIERSLPKYISKHIQQSVRDMPRLSIPRNEWEDIKYQNNQAIERSLPNIFQNTYGKV